MKSERFTVLLAEDNEDDRFLMQKAFAQHCDDCDLKAVEDGEEAIAYMMGEGQFADRLKFPYPSFIITDLKMPRKDGFAVLEFLKKNPEWAIIPTVVLSGSANADDVKRSYTLGASSYHVKPSGSKELCHLVTTLVAYWRLCEVPAKDVTGRRMPTDSTGRLGERFTDDQGGPISR